jgi:hypothetical protein
VEKLQAWVGSVARYGEQTFSIYSKLSAARASTSANLNVDARHTIPQANAESPVLRGKSVLAIASDPSQTRPGASPPSTALTFDTTV